MAGVVSVCASHRSPSGRHLRLHVILAVSICGALLPPTTSGQPATEPEVIRVTSQNEAGDAIGKVGLSDAIAAALADPRDNVIRFDPALAGQSGAVIVLMRSLRITGGGRLVIDATQLAGPLVIDASRCPDSGITVEEDAEVTLRGLALRGAGQRNLLLRGRSRLRLERTAIENSRGPGAVLYDDARLEATGCRFAGNATHGVEVHDRAAVVLTDCRIEENRQAGVAAFQEARLELTGCALETTGPWHLSATDRSRLILERCRLIGSSFAVADLGQSAGLRLDHCTVTAGRRFGVFATGRSRVESTGTHFRQMGYRGFELQDTAAAVLNDCRIETCADYGMILFHRAEVRAHGSLFAHNGAHGVSLREQARASFEACFFTGNRYSGVGCPDDREGGRVAVRRSLFQANGMRPLYRGPCHLDPPVPIPLTIRGGRVLCRTAPRAEVDLFLDRAGEAGQFLRSLTADDRGEFEVAYADLAPGQCLVAAATSGGATSEFNVIAGGPHEPLLAALLGQTGPLSDRGSVTDMNARLRCWPRGTRLIFVLPRSPPAAVERYARVFVSHIHAWTRGAVQAEIRIGPHPRIPADAVPVSVRYLSADHPQLEGVGGVTLMRWTMDGYFVRPMEILLAASPDPRETCPRILGHEMGHALGLGHARVGLLSRMQGSAPPLESAMVNDFCPILTFYDVQALHLLYDPANRPGSTLGEVMPGGEPATLARSGQTAEVVQQPTFSPPPQPVPPQAGSSR